MNKTTSVILQPEYVELFQCDGNKCNAKCCKKWRIDIDIDTYKKYKRIKKQNIQWQIYLLFPYFENNPLHLQA